ncbi:hypothetical protein C8R44DRAFT_760454 [Mycena epipterygia]|nr:hypothetical protein C8R44DRAFT_760454 [Mycena epipterygia]
MDKSAYWEDLIVRVFQNLVKRLDDSDPLDLSIARNIVKQILQFKNENGDSLSLWNASSQCYNAVYSFCALADLEQPTLTLAVRLASGIPRTRLTGSISMEIGWVHTALEQLWIAESRDIDEIGDFLQALISCRSFGDIPISTNVLNTILWGISFDGVYVGRTQYLAYCVLCYAEKWFQDDRLRPLLQEKSIWTLLGKYMAWDPAAYLLLGDKLSQTVQWKTTLAQDYFGWFSQLLRILKLPLDDEEQRGQLFCSVLSRIWDVNPTQCARFKDKENILAMAFIVLGKLWDQVNFPDQHDIQHVIQLTQCTLSTALCTRMNQYSISRIVTPSQDFRDTIMVSLGNAITRAADRVKVSTSQIAADVEDCGVEILSKLAVIINEELRTRPTPDDPRDKEEQRYWRDLKRNFEEEIHSDHPGYSNPWGVSTLDFQSTSFRALKTPLLLPFGGVLDVRPSDLNQ